MAQNFDLNVERYHVDAKNPLGQGAYGIVYRAVDSAGCKAAAKRIDFGRKHNIPNFSKDVQTLQQLSHQNIVKIFDTVQVENLTWMFMELCEYGDLNKYCRNKEISLQTKFKIMSQIAQGVQYLHRNNVVHRDIKPENILVAQDSPMQIKLTDFDVSKFFEEIFDTSAMSTNVGTLAFKAPEFFQRTPEGKLLYHRNVDVYAMGLTFLALLQSTPDTKQLKPQIETYNDPSDKFTHSIGQLICERKKYNSGDLSILHTAPVSGAVSREEELRNGVRALIQKMTHVDPEKRSSAEVVSRYLVQARLIPDVSFTEASKIDRYGFGLIFINSKNQLFRIRDYRQSDEIQVYDRDSGQLLKEIKHHCNHADCSLYTFCGHPTDPDRLLDVCSECQRISCYNLNTGQWKEVYSGDIFLYRMCQGPAGTVLGMNMKRQLCQFEWTEEKEKLQVHHRVGLDVPVVNGMCYSEREDYVIVTHEYGFKAFSRQDGSVIWNRSINGEGFHPRGVCCDEDGRIYVACIVKGILILDSRTGEHLQYKDIGEHVWEVFWTNTKPQLTIETVGRIYTYKVDEL